MGWKCSTNSGWAGALRRRAVRVNRPRGYGAPGRAHGVDPAAEALGLVHRIVGVAEQGAEDLAVARVDGHAWRRATRARGRPG